MTTASLLIRPALSHDELAEHVNGYVQVAQSFSPDPLPEDAATRRLQRITTFPGYCPEQIRSAYRNGEQLGGCRESRNYLHFQLSTCCTGLTELFREKGRIPS